MRNRPCIKIASITFARKLAARNSRRRSFGGFSAFIVALFTEMYGIPVTIYLLSGWLQRRYPGRDPLSHDTGHLWWTLTGRHGNPHFGILHILSNALIFGGFILLSAAWNVLYRALRKHELAVTGVYGYLRHPQYVAFIAIMLGFLLQWPTILTVLMFPALVWMYVHLALTEEREAQHEFGAALERATRCCARRLTICWTKPWCKVLR